MGNLSEHFDSSEFRCPCCKKVKIDLKLIDKLEIVRQVIGNIPIEITSGYRCKKYNQSIGGYSDSPHLTGLAADTKCGLRIVDYALAADLVTGIRLGLYPNHLHIDIIDPWPSKYWVVMKYGSMPIYSKYEYDLKIFLKGVMGDAFN